MITFETSDQKEVRRFRIAQFNGRAATVESGGRTITGRIRSVQEKEFSVPPCWTVTIVPEPHRRRPCCAPRRASRVSRKKTSIELQAAGQALPKHDQAGSVSCLGLRVASSQCWLRRCAG